MAHNNLVRNSSLVLNVLLAGCLLRVSWSGRRMPAIIRPLLEAYLQPQAAASGIQLGSGASISSCNAATAHPAASLDEQASLPHIIIVYAACGNDTAVQQFSVSLTSLFHMAVSRGHRYDVIVLTDGAVTRQQLPSFQSRLNVSLQRTNPGARMLWRLCSTERLYLHEHPGLVGVSDLMYVDADTLWAADPALLWGQLADFGAAAAWGFAAESDDVGGTGAIACDWYTTGPGQAFGVRPHEAINAGVALLRLDLIRRSNWTAERDAIIAAHGDQLTLGDQDVLNVYFAAEQNFLLLHRLPCTVNFRGQCGCPAAAYQPPILLHGNVQTRDSTAGRQYAMLYAAYRRQWLQMRGELR